MLQVVYWLEFVTSYGPPILLVCLVKRRWLGILLGTLVFWFVGFLWSDFQCTPWYNKRYVVPAHLPWNQCDETALIMFWFGWLLGGVYCLLLWAGVRLIKAVARLMRD
jgi:hypothetical protein